jgi:hypothetical protein
MTVCELTPPVASHVNQAVGDNEVTVVLLYSVGPTPWKELVHIWAQRRVEFDVLPPVARMAVV